MKIVEKSESTTVSHIMQINDDEKNEKWFIEVETLNGKFKSIREILNPRRLDLLGMHYKTEVFNLAYFSVFPKSTIENEE